MSTKSVVPRRQVPGMLPWSSQSQSSDVVSPTPSSPSHTAVDIPADIYYDPRDVPGPSRYVKAHLTHIESGGVLARSTDGMHCAVAGKDYLKVLKINGFGFNGTVGSTGETASNTSRPGTRRAKLVGRGPGGATIHEDVTIRLSQNTLSNEIGWGYGPNANKIVVASMSGDIIIADHTKAKVERVIKEHTRSVNGLAFTPHLPHCFATCGQDGYVKIWDTRKLDYSSVSINHKISTRAVSFSPQPSTPWHAVVALENGGFYKWDYRQNGPGLLERCTAAHANTITDMEWVGPGVGSDGAGWLVTGGLDRTVKIWDMSQRLQDQKPLHVLHTAERVKRAAWRPGYDTEVAVVPFTPGLSIRPSESRELSDADRIEIWDVRRPWLPKYVLDGGEGAVVSMTWSGPDALWATYSNGTIVQHDLRECYRPMDSMPRSALTWEPNGSITYANEAISADDPPYDDVKPSLKAFLAEKGWKEKGPSDLDYVPINQTVATVTLPMFDLEGFVDLARGYLLAPESGEGDEKTMADVCLSNAEVAHQAKYYRASHTWLMLRDLLTPLELPEEAVQDEDLQSMVSPSGRPASLVLPNLPKGVSSSATFPALPTPSRPLFRPSDRRTFSTSHIQFTNASSPKAMSVKIANSSDNSPAPEGRARQVSNSSSVAPTANNSARPSTSRRSSAATKVSRGSGGTRRKGSGSQEGRSVSRSRGRSISNDDTAEMRSRANSRAIARITTDGALDSSDDDDEVPPSTSSGFGHSAKSSLTSNTLEVPNEEDEHMPSSESRRRAYSRVPLPDPDVYWDEQSDAGALGDDNYTASSSSEERKSLKAPPSSPILSRYDRPRISKQDSRSSIKTAVPSSGRQKYLYDGDLQEGQATLGSSTEGEFGGSTRRPSPATSGTERAYPRGGALGVSVKPTEESIIEVPSPHIKSQHLSSHTASPRLSSEQTPLLRETALLNTDRSSYGGRKSRVPSGDGPEESRGRSLLRKQPTQLPISPSLVMEQERQLRELGWAAMREAFTYYSENGDVQMCTALDTVSRGELTPEDDVLAVDRLSYAYVELLNRLRLHTSAAYVRKYGASTELKRSTNVDAVVHTSCGSCRRPLTKTAGSTDSNILPAAGTHQRSLSASDRQGGVRSRSRAAAAKSGDAGDSGSSDLAEGGYGFCASCKRASARCSICRLPVRGLHFFCPVCSHGGHHECYRQYYLRHKMITATSSKQDTPGANGWGLAVLVQEERPRTESGSARSDRRDSIASDNSGSTGKEREGGIVGTVAGLAVLGLGGGSKEKTPRERDRESVRTRDAPNREREPLRKKLASHPCAAGCGHMCWIANDTISP